MNRRYFTKLLGLGVFSILPGAGRVWRIQRKLAPEFHFYPTMQDFLRLERHPLRFRFDVYNSLFLPTTWSPNMAEPKRLVILPGQDLKRPT